jgi:signal transduction histidine kinase
VKSIRLRLLIPLIMLFIFSWMVLAIAIFIGSKDETEELFDAELARSARIVADLSAGYLKDPATLKTQLTEHRYGHEYENKISFQLWQGDEVWFRSANAPVEPMAERMGFSDREFGGGSWRVFGMPLEEQGRVLFVAEDYEVRNELITKIIYSSLWPLVWALPILALLIIFGIKRGLDPLGRFAAEVGKRTPRQLDPVDDSQAPEEILPLTGALNRLLQRLNEALETERRFTADAAHELRTPLAAIRTHAQLARRAADNPESRETLDKVIEAVDRSSHLVSQMLVLARLDPETAAYDFQPVDLERIVDGQVAELKPMAEEKEILLTMDTAAGRPDDYLIQGYGIGLEILLRNLMDNAIRYTPAGGRVEVGLRRDADTAVRLRVADNGPGIPGEKSQRIFDRFYREAGHDSYGCGLGLSIVQRIATLQQAEIRMSWGLDGRGVGIEVIFSL